MVLVCDVLVLVCVVIGSSHLKPLDHSWDSQTSQTIGPWLGFSNISSFLTAFLVWSFWFVVPMVLVVMVNMIPVLIMTLKYRSWWWKWQSPLVFLCPFQHPHHSLVTGKGLITLLQWWWWWLWLRRWWWCQRRRSSGWKGKSAGHIGELIWKKNVCETLSIWVGRTRKNRQFWSLFLQETSRNINIPFCLKV